MLVVTTANLGSMTRLKLRSPRDPEFWLPAGISLVAVVAAGYFAHARVSELLAELELLAATDPGAAIEQAVYWLRGATLAFCALLAVFCLLLFRSCQLARREGRMPPSGWWSYGALYAKTGEAARRMARLGQWLAGLLLLASLGLAIVVEYTVRLLLSGNLAG
jgi:hypothetical protein